MRTVPGLIYSLLTIPPSRCTRFRVPPADISHYIHYPRCHRALFLSFSHLVDNITDVASRYPLLFLIKISFTASLSLFIFFLF